MNHPPLTASHAAFFGRWLLICIGACFLGAQYARLGYSAFFIPHLLPICLFTCILAGQFLVLYDLMEEPPSLWLGCLGLPICVLIVGCMGVWLVIPYRALDFGSSWWANMLHMMLAGAFFGLCQLVAMPPLPGNRMLWPLCTAASAAIGLGALYLLAPETTIFGPSITTSQDDAGTYTRWGDLITLGMAFGAVFGVTSGAALTWMLRARIPKHSFMGMWGIDGAAGVILAILAFQWTHEIDRTILPATRPDDFTITYDITDSSKTGFFISQDTCKYASLPQSIFEPKPPIVQPISPQDRDLIFQAMRDAHIDHFPTVSRFKPLSFDLAWDGLTFTLDGQEYAILFEVHEYFSNAQRNRLQHVVDTMSQVCRANEPDAQAAH